MTLYLSNYRLMIQFAILNDPNLISFVHLAFWFLHYFLLLPTNCELVNLLHYQTSFLNLNQMKMNAKLRHHHHDVKN
jgi:hypothetical protein